MQIERRRHIRIPGPFTAAIQNGDQTTLGRIVNLSEGGCYVDGVASSPAVGSVVILEIQVPNAETLIVSGEASFRRTGGYAVLFKGLPRAVYEDLERVVGTLRNDAW